MEVDHEDASITLDDDEVKRFKKDGEFRARVIRRAEDLESTRTVLIQDPNGEILESVKSYD